MTKWPWSCHFLAFQKVLGFIVNLNFFFLFTSSNHKKWFSNRQSTCRFYSLIRVILVTICLENFLNLRLEFECKVQVATSRCWPNLSKRFVITNLKRERFFFLRIVSLKKIIDFRRSPESTRKLSTTRDPTTLGLRFLIVP